ncbi:hypothetical protein MTR67_052383, partial [Solanum verrucosum]
MLISLLLEYNQQRRDTQLHSSLLTACCDLAAIDIIGRDLGVFGSSRKNFVIITINCFV